MIVEVPLRDCAREACFGATTGPIVAAARARGIPVMRLDGDCLLQLGHGARQRRVQGVITGGTGYLAESISRDKLLTKRLMRQLGLPTAEGRLVQDAEDAWAAACEIGLPVVVKPRDADYGNGVSVHLLTKEQVVAGWELARQFRTDVLVERHLAETEGKSKHDYAREDFVERLQHLRPSLLLFLLAVNAIQDSARRAGRP